MISFSGTVVWDQKRGGRRCCLLSLVGEPAFLKLFQQANTIGQIATEAEIQEMPEKRIGNKICKTIDYRSLKQRG